ncbi:transposase [Couchioplanes caeruleus]|uniref:transposase n=1 Tax=Couchioplanes caeruleus TaxID=56438 RepID=UPI002467E252|nr:transposase [Couchioplanes caeruleus]
MRWARRVFSHHALTGVSRRHLHLLVAELRPVWRAGREARLHTRRGGCRRRAPGAGRPPTLRFTDRLVVTLAHLRLGLPHEAIAVVFGVDRSTITRAIGQLRPLLASRGCAAPSGVRLHSLADVFAYAAAEGVTVRLDATEIRVRRPRAGRGGRKAFVSGKLKQNTIKTTVAADQHGATLWCGSTRPGRMHDTTAARIEGIEVLLQLHPTVRLLVDAGYQGLARDHPDQVSAPPLKPRPGVPVERHIQWQTARKAQSSQRIPVEHAIAEHKWWRVLQRFTGRRELLPETINAVAGIVSDRSGPFPLRSR